MKFSQKFFENWWFWKMHFFWVGHFEFFFSKKIFFFFFPMKISQSLLVSKDCSKFWSSQTWQHFLTHTKHSWGECTWSENAKKCKHKQWKLPNDTFYVHFDWLKVQKSLINLQNSENGLSLRWNINYTKTSEF